MNAAESERDRDHAKFARVQGVFPLSEDTSSRSGPAAQENPSIVLSAFSLHPLHDPIPGQTPSYIPILPPPYSAAGVTWARWWFAVLLICCPVPCCPLACLSCSCRWRVPLISLNLTSRAGHRRRPGFETAGNPPSSIVRINGRASLSVVSIGRAKNGRPAANQLRPSAMDSSSAPEQSSGRPSMEAQGRTAGIGRAFKRLKTAFRMSGSPRRDTASPTPTAENPARQVEAQQEGPEPVPPVDDVLEARSAAALPSSEAHMLRSDSVNLENLVVDDEAGTPLPPPDPTAYLIDSEHRERARLLFEKYGLNFNAKDLTPAPVPSSSSRRDRGVLRVEKQIRMRIRYSCHRCQTTFGATFICTRCEHHRCKRCPRHPPKKPKRLDRRPEAAQQERDHDGKAMDVDREAKNAKRSSGSPVAVNAPQASTSESVPQSTLLEREPRACHRCRAAFSPIEAQICANCGGHLRHFKRSGEPGIPLDLHPGSGETLPDRPSSQPTPSTQRSDRAYRVPRQRIRWTCDQCQTDFELDSTICSACLHRRCSSCTRIPDVSSLYGLVQSSAQTESRLDNADDLDHDGDITTPVQSHIHDFAILHAPAITAPGSGG